MNNNLNTEQEAGTIIRNHVIWAMGAGLIPVPVADIFAVSAVQLDMVRQMCKLYDVDFSETQGKAVISALTSSSLARIGARIATKIIPGIGSLVGGVSMAILSGASTYAIGEVFKNHFETGGTFLDFDAERLKKYYNEKFEKGKKVAKDLKKEQETKITEPVVTTAPTPTPEPTFNTPAPTPSISANQPTVIITKNPPETTEAISPKPKDANEIMNKLKELWELKNAGAITDAEFEQMKKKVLGD